MKKYNKIILYYFTGTGNSLKAGRWIKEEAEKRGLDTKLYPIDNFYKPNPDEFDNDTLIGFLSPTHGFNIAPAMMKFLFKFPRKIKADVFILNTRAGLKFGKIFIPGLSGTAQLLSMLFLKVKGYSVRGGLPLDMPSNWLFCHSGLKQEKVDAIVKRCELKTKTFINNILDGKKLFRKVLISLPFDIAILPISILYYIYGRFILAKTMIYTSECRDCNLCANNCPVQAIKMINNRPYWTYSCESCMRCVNICPKKCIETSHLIFLFLLIFPGMIFNSYLLKYFRLLPLSEIGLLRSALEMGITLIELYIFYKLIQLILRFKLFGNLFKYSSLSAYWRRYRAPGITIKDFKKVK